MDTKDMEAVQAGSPLDVEPQEQGVGLLMSISPEGEVEDMAKKDQSLVEAVRTGEPLPEDGMAYKMRDALNQVAEYIEGNVAIVGKSEGDASPKTMGHTSIEFSRPDYEGLLKVVGDSVDARNFSLPDEEGSKFHCEMVLWERALLTSRGRMVVSARVQRKKLDDGKKGRPFVTVVLQLPSRPAIFVPPDVVANLSALLRNGFVEEACDAQAGLDKEMRDRKEKDIADWQAGLEGKKPGMVTKKTGKTERMREKGKTSAQRKAERSARDQEIRNKMRKGGR